MLQYDQVNESDNLFYHMKSHHMLTSNQLPKQSKLSPSQFPPAFEYDPNKFGLSSVSACRLPPVVAALSIVDSIAAAAQQLPHTPTDGIPSLSAPTLSLPLSHTLSSPS